MKVPRIGPDRAPPFRPRTIPATERGRRLAAIGGLPVFAGLTIMLALIDRGRTSPAAIPHPALIVVGLILAGVWVVREPRAGGRSGNQA